MVYARYELSPENSSKMGKVEAFWPEAHHSRWSAVVCVSTPAATGSLIYCDAAGLCGRVKTHEN